MKIINMLKAKWSREPNHEVIFDLTPGDIISIQGADTGRELMTFALGSTLDGRTHHAAVKTIVEIDEDKNMRAISFVFPVNPTAEPGPIRLEIRDIGEAWADDKPPKDPPKKPATRKPNTRPHRKGDAKVPEKADWNKEVI